MEKKNKKPQNLHFLLKTLCKKTHIWEKFIFSKTIFFFKTKIPLKKLKNGKIEK